MLLSANPLPPSLSLVAGECSLEIDSPFDLAFARQIVKLRADEDNMNGDTGGGGGESRDERAGLTRPHFWPLSLF